MDLLVFGHDGPKVIVFPTSQGRFYEYEDNKMIAALADRLEQRPVAGLLRRQRRWRELVQQGGASLLASPAAPAI